MQFPPTVDYNGTTFHKFEDKDIIMITISDGTQIKIFAEDMLKYFVDTIKYNRIAAIQSLETNEIVKELERAY